MAPRAQPRWKGSIAPGRSCLDLRRSVLPRSFDYGFATGLMVKDVRLAVEEMRSLGLSMEVAEAVGRLWETIIREQGADSDFTEAIKPIEKQAGVIVGGAKGGVVAK